MYNYLRKKMKRRYWKELRLQELTKQSLLWRGMWKKKEEKEKSERKSGRERDKIK
jgi:hypothetical protein